VAAGGQFMAKTALHSIGIVIERGAWSVQDNVADGQPGSRGCALLLLVTSRREMREKEHA